MQNGYFIPLLDFSMSKSKLIHFAGGRILRNHAIYYDSLWVKEGKFVDPQLIPDEEKRKEDVNVIHLGGYVVVPGFIDLHVQGGFGVDLTYDLPHSAKAIDVLAKNLLSCGVTSFCPTLVSSKPETYRKIVRFLKARPGGFEGANILGGHIEGPFINKEKKGKHIAHFARDLGGVDTILETYSDLSPIRMITLAPEKVKDMKVIDWLVKNNIIVCLGHTLASLSQAKKAIERGAKLVSHFYNSMTPFHHRDPGIIGLLGSRHYKDQFFYTIVADGYHNHPTALKLAFKSHPDGLILTTLSNAAMGVSHKKIYHIGEQAIEVRENIGYVAKTAVLGGGVKRMTFCIKTFLEATKCPLIKALEAASLQPARALGIENKKGTLNFESDADFAVLSKELDVISTWIAGECVFTTYRTT